VWASDRLIINRERDVGFLEVKVMGVINGDGLDYLRALFINVIRALSFAYCFVSEESGVDLGKQEYMIGIFSERFNTIKSASVETLPILAIPSSFMADELFDI